MRSRSRGSRPMAVSTTPAACGSRPCTSARYRRSTVRALSWRASPRWARSVLATTRRPDVPRSRRWTMPGRRAPPIPERSAPQCASNACTRVPVRCPAPGWTTSPTGLFTTRRSASSWTIASGMASGTRVKGSGGGTSTVISAPARRRWLAFGWPPVTATCPLAISAWSRVLERSGAWACRKRSSRVPAASGSTTKRRDVGPSAPGAGARGSAVGGVAPRDIVPPERQLGGQERHADRDRRVRHVERWPVVAAPEDVEEVHHRAEPPAVEEVTGRAAEHEPDRDARQEAAPRQKAEGERAEQGERGQGEQADDPAPAGRHAGEDPERHARIHDEHELEEVRDHHDRVDGVEPRERPLL